MSIKQKYLSVKKFETIKEMLEMAVQDVPDKLAFRYKKDGGIADVTYKQFYDETMALGTGLASLGIADTHIAMISENRYKWICTYLTVLKSSGVYVPIDKELPLGDFLNIINDSDSTVLFYSKKYEEIIKENVGNMPNLARFIGLDREEDSVDGMFLSYDKLLEKGRALYESGDRKYADMSNDPNALKLLVYTSGTTGNAKGVMLTEHNLVSSVYYGLQVSTIYDVGLSVLPYHHTYEAVPGILVAIHNHTTLCINDSLKNVLANLNLFKPQSIYVVPAFAEVFYKKIWATVRKQNKEKGLKLLIKTANALHLSFNARRKLFKQIHDSFGGNLIKIVCGGAPVRSEIGDFFNSIGITLLNGYGITECSPLVSVNQDYMNDCRTVGIPLPCCEIKIDDADEDGNGEICVKGDVVMKGYYKQPELTAEVLEENGWFHTGDYGRINEKGQILITGRKKNLIVLDNGKNIFPEEIEGYIQNIPYVSEVVVYGHQNEYGQEVALYAEVYMAEDKLKEFEVNNPESQLKADIAKEYPQNLPEYKKVSKIIIRDTEFEKTTTNKIRRNKIVKQ